MADPRHGLTPEKAMVVREAALRLGVRPEDLAVAIAYETIRTFSPSIRGGDENKYVGLIQFGPNEQQKYGVSKSQTFEEQTLNSVVPFLRDRGVKPGMGLAHIYSAINAGSLDKGQPFWNRRDSSRKTVRQHVGEMTRDYGPMMSAAVRAVGVDDYPVPRRSPPLAGWSLLPGAAPVVSGKLIPGARSFDEVPYRPVPPHPRLRPTKRTDDRTEGSRHFGKAQKVRVAEIERMMADGDPSYWRDEAVQAEYRDLITALRRDEEMQRRQVAKRNRRARSYV